MSETAAPMEGIRVFNFSTLLSGPLATLMLADAGADVVKIERPGTGDKVRSYSPKLGDSSAIHALLNRGKRSFAVDLRKGAAALEEKFWTRFVELISLPTEFRRDAGNEDRVTDEVSARVVGHAADHWREVFDAHDCCVTVVDTFQEAAAAGLTDREATRRTHGDGFDVAALPGPLSPALLSKQIHATSPSLDPLPANLDDVWAADGSPTHRHAP